MGGVREPFDRRIAGAADAVAREKDRVDPWNLLPSESSGSVGEAGRRPVSELGRGKGKFWPYGERFGGREEE